MVVATIVVVIVVVVAAAVAAVEVGLSTVGLLVVARAALVVAAEGLELLHLGRVGLGHHHAWVHVGVAGEVGGGGELLLLRGVVWLRRPHHLLLEHGLHVWIVHVQHLQRGLLLELLGLGLGLLNRLLGIFWLLNLPKSMMIA